MSAGRLHRLHRGVYAVGHARLAYPGRLPGAVFASVTTDAATSTRRLRRLLT